jgi:hypothetical protein
MLSSERMGMMGIGQGRDNKTKGAAKMNFEGPTLELPFYLMKTIWLKKDGQSLTLL